MYESFLKSISAPQWQRIGLRKRAGIATPLFSIYSKKSIGIGELPDLKLLIDWCRAAGMSIIQLLPMNDVGFSFTPYDAQSGFALEPMYLSLDHLVEVKTKLYAKDIESLRKKFSVQRASVNYKIKAAKLDLLWKIFKEQVSKDLASFGKYCLKNEFWLKHYACFKVIKEENAGKSWEEWPLPFKEKNPQAIQDFERTHQERIRFYEWLQWQLSEQFKEVRKYAQSKKVFLMGDLPFLASRDSADVWSHPDYFKLDLSSGAPPDAYFFKGQRWGMPPCRWENIEKDSYRYIIEKLKYAENFYGLLRIDHCVGFFRLWSIPVSEPPENAGLNGFFDPADERQWEGQGRKLLSVMIEHSKMLVCAEDLGTVPECSWRVLEEFGIPGMDVQRWIRDSGNDYAFKTPEQYRENSIAVLSTHDIASFNAWWEHEAGTVYEPLFERQYKSKGIPFEGVKLRLFDLEQSAHDRLRWKQEIRSEDILLQILGRPRAEIEDLIDLYRFSYDEKAKFWNYLGLPGECEKKTSQALVKAAFEKISSARSIFSIQLLQDWLALGNTLKGDSWDMRINFPGILSDQNWSLAMPISLEEMKSLPINKEIKAINVQARRI